MTDINDDTYLPFIQPDAWYHTDALPAFLELPGSETFREIGQTTPEQQRQGADLLEQQAARFDAEATALRHGAHTLRALAAGAISVEPDPAAGATP